MDAVIISGLLSVNDFVIAGDTVFFCGRNTYYDMGFFGHFNIQDFFFGTHSYTVSDYTFNSVSGHLNTFNKMVTYIENGERRFAAIGQTPQGNYVTAEVEYHPSVPEYHYIIGELDIAYNESLLDITQTDNYVVTGGFKVPGVDPWPSFRIYEKTSLFAASGPQDNVKYFFETGSITTYYNGTQLLLSHLQADIFAVAAFWRPTSITADAGTYIGKYDITNQNVTHSGSIRTTQNSYLGGWKLCGMTSLGSATSFYLLENAELNKQNYLANLIFELDLSIWSPNFPPNINVRYRPDPLLQSIDSQGVITDFVSNGFYVATPYMLGYYNSMATATVNNCYNSTQYTPSNLSMNQTLVTSNTFTVQEGSVNVFQTYVGQPLNLVVELGCYE